LVPLVAFAAAVTAQVFAAQSAIDRPNDPLYLPDARVARHLDLGLGEAWADWLHIQALIYVVEEFDDKQAEIDAAATELERQTALRNAKYRWLAQLYDAITELDPKFREAYLYGARFLTLLSKEQDQAIALLELGILANPGDAELMEELGMIYYVDKKDTEAALKWLQAAVDHNSPNHMLVGFVARISEGTSYDQAVGESLARQVKRYAAAGDHRMESAMRDKLREHTARIALRRLTDTLAQLRARGVQTGEFTMEAIQQACYATNRLPQGFFEAAGGFWYDPATGDIESSALAPSERDRRIRRISHLFVGFRAAHGGRWPLDRDEFNGWSTEPLPHHPLPGWRWSWNPETGEIGDRAP
jgi:tetratricopeptide (TPR) repeat protein